MRTTFLAFAVISLLTVPSGPFSQQKTFLTPSLDSDARLNQWTVDGSGSWKISNGLLRLWKAGVPSGPIRRPAALAILKTRPFRKVTIKAQIRCTAPLEVVRRDLDVIVAYESPTRFYYIHLAGVSDSVHNGIFLVNNANRVRIDAGRSTAQLRDSIWHSVRVERDGQSGRIAVYVGNAKAPVLDAVDTTICCGRVGFGSFDDTGEFRRITVSGSAR